MPLPVDEEDRALLGEGQGPERDVLVQGQRLRLPARHVVDREEERLSAREDGRRIGPGPHRHGAVRSQTRHQPWAPTPTAASGNARTSSGATSSATGQRYARPASAKWGGRCAGSRRAARSWRVRRRPSGPIVEGEPRRPDGRHPDHLDLGRQHLEGEVRAVARQEPDSQALPVGEQARVERRAAGPKPARELVDGEMPHGDEIGRRARTAGSHKVTLGVGPGGVNRATRRQGAPPLVVRDPGRRLPGEPLAPGRDLSYDRASVALDAVSGRTSRRRVRMADDGPRDDARSWSWHAGRAACWKHSASSSRSSAGST